MFGRRIISAPQVKEPNPYGDERYTKERGGLRGDEWAAG